MEGIDYIVGKPLLRPPPGWDIRNSQKSQRWAWLNEEPSTLEKNIAPRVKPTYWLLKTLVLIIISLTLLHCLVLCIFIVPVSVGRGLFQMLYIPRSLNHDPLCFIIGSYLVIGLMNSSYKFFFNSNLLNNNQLKNHPILLTAKYLYIRGKCSMSFVTTSKFFVYRCPFLLFSISACFSYLFVCLLMFSFFLFSCQ
jgi:hypothetical protein